MTLSSEQIKQYQELGYLLLSQLLDLERLHTLTQDCMNAWVNEKGPFDPEGTWLHNALLTDIEQKSTCVRDYYRQGPLVDVAEQLIGPNIKGAATQLTFKMRGNAMPFGWHQDNGYGQLDPPNALTTLTALDDADEENGCLWVIPGSHLLGQIDVSDRLSVASKASGADLSVDVDDPELAIPVIMKAGDAVVFHGHTLHRSEGNHSLQRDRRLLFMRYADADAVEVYNQGSPRRGPLLRGQSRFAEVRDFDQPL